MHIQWIHIFYLTKFSLINLIDNNNKLFSLVLNNNQMNPIYFVFSNGLVLLNKFVKAFEPNFKISSVITLSLIVLIIP